MRGNCYVTSEALYHVLGGKPAGWKPMRMRHENDSHWFLLNTNTGQRIDATCFQFNKPPSEAQYSRAIGSGFLTRHPSKRAAQLIAVLTWGVENCAL